MVKNNKYTKIMMLAFVALWGTNGTLSAENEDSVQSNIVQKSSSSSNKFQNIKKVRYVPPMTYDVTFKMLFGGTIDQEKSKKFLKAFLNDIYKYNDKVQITDLEYLPTETAGPTPGTTQKGKLIYDIRCLCTLNDNNKTQFIVEMQRARQHSYIERILLGSSAVTTDGYRSSVSETSEKRSSHDTFRDHVPEIKHLSILLDDYDSSMGSVFHIIPVAVEAELECAKVIEDSIKFPDKNKVATDKLLHTLIQLNQYVKETDNTKKSEWLDLLSVELRGTENEKRDKTFGISEADDKIVEEAIEFMQSNMKSAAEKLKEAMAQEDARQIKYWQDRVKKAVEELRQTRLAGEKALAEERAKSEKQRKINEKLKKLLEEHGLQYEEENTGE